MSYFDLFPSVTDAQSGAQLRNISLSVIFPQIQLPPTSSYLPYVVKEGETPLQLSYNYYDSINYVWLIAVANHIVDFASQWPMQASVFERYIVSKYGSIESATSTIAYYKSAIDPTYPTLSPFTFQNTSNSIIGLMQLVPVTQYQDELDKNEAKRPIYLIDKTYAPGLTLQVSQLMTP